jgi:hypothetical protein
MYNSHRPADISRRRFGGLVLAGAAAGIVPVAARAAGEKPPLPALAVMCIDYRLVHAGVDFFDSHVGLKKYDIVALAGASLGAGSVTNFTKTVGGFYEQVWGAWNLHKIQAVVFVDHMGCGAYKVDFNGGKDFDPPESERPYHVKVMRKVAAEFPEKTAALRLPKIGLDFWLFSDPDRGAPVAEHIDLDKEP